MYHCQQPYLRLIYMLQIWTSTVKTITLLPYFNIVMAVAILQKATVASKTIATTINNTSNFIGDDNDNNNIAITNADINN